MKAEYLRTRTFLLGILGLAAGGLGCSDSGDGGDSPSGAGGVPVGGAAGSGVTAGAPGTAGKAATGGSLGSGGSAGTGVTAGTGGTVAGTTGAGSGGTGTGNAGKGGTGTGDAGKGGTGGGSGGKGGGGAAGKGGASSGGASSGGASSGGAPNGGSGGQFTGTCTASKSTGRNASGTGPYDVVIETNSENGIKCGTIYRPKDLGGTEKFPIFAWGEGACSQDGYSNQAAMAEIASWGYFVVADGTPGGSGACAGSQDGKQLLNYITWAIAENDKPCSAYYQRLQPTKVAVDGFSCGGVMSETASVDPRITAGGITSSGLMGGNSAAVWDKIHAPFKIMNGGPNAVEYQNGLRDYDALSSRGIPIVYFSKTSAGHGGDLNNGRGDFNRVNLAWLNWQLKGDMGATGKGFLHGSTCEFCTNSGWTYKSANIQ